MRKLCYFMLMMIYAITAFTACSSDNDDNAPVTNPVTNVRVPSSATIGQELLITGEGFDSSIAKLSLKDQSGKETTLSNVSYTASGATVTLPYSLTAGTYTVVLNQNGTWELGTVNLLAAALPVTDIAVPAAGGIGHDIIITGNGFKSNTQIYLEDANGTRSELAISDRTSGLVCQIPASLSKGTYKVVVAQDGGEWTLDNTIELAVVKTLKSIGLSTVQSQSGDILGDGSTWTMSMTSSTIWSMTQSNGVPSKLIRTISMKQEIYNDKGEHLTDMEGEMGGEEAYNVSVSGNTYSFSYDETASGASDETDMDPFTLEVSNGQVIKNSVTRLSQGDTDAATYNWNYDNAGYLNTLYVSDPNKGYVTYTYDANHNVTNYKASMTSDFVYGGTQVNNPFALDVVSCYLSFNYNFEPFEVAAHLMGWTGNHSTALPTTVDEQKIDYVIDADGYVTSFTIHTAEAGDITFTMTYE